MPNMWNTSYLKNLHSKKVEKNLESWILWTQDFIMNSIKDEWWIFEPDYLKIILCTLFPTLIN